MTTRFNQPSLRPAPALPPTLQPHAVLALAPPTDRRRSAAMSAAVYAVLAGGAIWFAHAGATAVLHPPVPVGPVVIIDPAPLAPAPMKTLATPATKATPLPVPAQAPTHPLIPDTTPTALPSENLSNLPPAQPQGNASPNTTGTGTGEAPLSISMDAVRILHQVTPSYPVLAKMSHRQGQVVIRMTIDAKGVPVQVETVSGPDMFLASATQAARQWRFTPAMQDGQPVAATFLLTLDFVLR